MAGMTPRAYTQRRRADDAARTRQRIITATRRLTVAGGTPSVDAIAAGAKVSVQTVYSHFGSKRGLLFATIDEVQRDASGRVTSVLRTLEEPQAGESIQLTIDLKTQREAQRALEWGMRAAHLQRGVVLVGLGPSLDLVAEDLAAVLEDPDAVVAPKRQLDLAG